MVDRAVAAPAAPSLELVAESALAPRTETLVPGLRLTTLPPRSIVRLQLGRAALVNAAGLHIGGVALPTEPNGTAGADPVLWWMAPNGWLATSTRPREALEAELRAACGARFATIVDVSDSLVAFALEGTASSALLARGTGIDLRPARFTVGQCFRTRLGHFAVLLRPTSADGVELLVDRSYGASLRDWLIDAAAGLPDPEGA